MAAHQAPPSLGFSRQEHWSGLPFPSPMHESEKSKWSCSVVFDSKRPHGLQPTRLLRPWDFPGKSTGVGCHCLQMKETQKTWVRSLGQGRSPAVGNGNPLQYSCLENPMDRGAWQATVCGLQSQIWLSTCRHAHGYAWLQQVDSKQSEQREKAHRLKSRKKQVWNSEIKNLLPVSHTGCTWFPPAMRYEMLSTGEAH